MIVILETPSGDQTFGDVGVVRVISDPRDCIEVHNGFLTDRLVDITFPISQGIVIERVQQTGPGTDRITIHALGQGEVTNEHVPN